MKVGIVGASEEKWTEEQKVQVKVKIKRMLIDHILLEAKANDYQEGTPNVVLVSGGCPKGGVDIWAEEIADKLGIKKEIYKPEVNQWEDKRLSFSIPRENIKGEGFAKGYRSRNIQIAEASDILYVISPKCSNYHRGIGYEIYCTKCRGTGRIWNGGEWTGNFCEKLGKKVVRISI